MNSSCMYYQPSLPLFFDYYEHKTFDENHMINITTDDYSTCPSHTHFGNISPYTLGFGQLFSGNLQYYRLPNRNCQGYQSFSFEISQCCYISFDELLGMTPIHLQQVPMLNGKVDEAVRNIRKTLDSYKKRYDPSLSFISDQPNQMVNHKDTNNS